MRTRWARLCRGRGRRPVGDDGCRHRRPDLRCDVDRSVPVELGRLVRPRDSDPVDTVPVQAVRGHPSAASDAWPSARHRAVRPTSRRSSWRRRTPRIPALRSAPRHRRRRAPFRRATIVCLRPSAGRRRSQVLQDIPVTRSPPHRCRPRRNSVLERGARAAGRTTPLRSGSPARSPPIRSTWRSASSIRSGGHRTHRDSAGLDAPAAFRLTLVESSPSRVAGSVSPSPRTLRWRSRRHIARGESQPTQRASVSPAFSAARRMARDGRPARHSAQRGAPTWRGHPIRLAACCKRPPL